MGQTIDNLSITPGNLDTININLTTVNANGFGYLSHEYYINNDTINLKVCYFLTIATVYTTIYSTIPIVLAQDTNQYVLDLTIINSYSVELCDYNSITDSTTMAFSTPVTDSLFLSVPTIESNLNGLVTIYPNPVHDILYINSDRLNIRLLTLFAHSGIKVKSQNKNNHELIVSDLSKGIYILKIDTDKGVISKKILKE